MTQKIAVLLTCHNRKEKTLACLSSLYNAANTDEFDLEVFLIDDGSLDGTTEAINKEFPDVHTFMGSGNLFWNQGMRLAWQKAIEFGTFDFYLWLNDDTIIDSDSISELINESKEISKRENLFLITAACREAKDSTSFSYGGRTDKGKVIPNGELQPCKYINGNFVLVPKALFLEIGNLSPDYTHGIGDNDYGLRTIEKGGQCYTTRKFLATCPINVGVPGWCNPNVPLKKRWLLLHSPLGLNIKEYIKFRRRFWGYKWMLFALKAYAKTLAPKLYIAISKL